MAKRKRSRSRSRGSGLKPTQIAIGGILYGFARNKISSTLKGFIPGTLGNISDEVLMGIISYLGATKGRGIIRDAAKAGLAIEASRLTQNISLGSVTNTTTNTSATGATFS